MAEPQGYTSLNYDPELPVYAQPENLQNTQTQLGTLKNSTEYVDPAKATVQGQLTGILQNGSPVLNAAEANATRAYNSRGLLNSASSVRAGQSAVIDNAIKIAQPDAQLYGNMAQQQQQTENNAALNNQLAGIENKKSQNSALISGALTTQQYAGDFEKQKIDSMAKLEQMDFDYKWKDYINTIQISEEKKKALMEIQGTLANELNGEVERILRDTNIPGDSKTAAITVLQKVYKSNIETTAAIAGLQFTW